MKLPTTRVFLLFFVCGLLGCGPGGPDLGEFGEVSGTVSVGGTPVKTGMITFNSRKTGQVATADIADGKYEMRLGNKQGLPLGEYHIAIRPPLQNREHVRRPGKSPAAAPSQPEVDIPEQYRFETSSGLTRVVKSGSNTFDFEL